MDSKEIKENTFVIQGGRCPAKEIYGKPRHYIDRNETTQKKNTRRNGCRTEIPDIVFSRDALVREASLLWIVLYHQQGQKTRLGEDD